MNPFCHLPFVLSQRRAGNKVSFSDHRHQTVLGKTIREQLSVAKPIRIGHDVWRGANSVILAGIATGDGAVAAAGVVVREDLPAYSVVAGAPAGIKKHRS